MTITITRNNIWPNNSREKERERRGNGWSGY
jgi:hypothetical protein